MSSENIDSVRRFYGSGTVFIADENAMRSFREYNFDVESLRKKVHGEYWIVDQIVVALGCDVTREAV